MKAWDAFAALFGRPAQALGSGAKAFFGLVCLGILGLAVLIGSGAPAADADAACPNEAIREQQHAQQLPDCRAWEMVSPLDKGNGDIVADGMTTIAAKQGDAVAFNGRTSFADTVGSAHGGHTVYLARRDATGWSTHSVTPTGRPDAIQTFIGSTKLQLFSDDLRTGVVWAYDLPGATDDGPERRNVYIEDTATRSLRTVTVPNPEHPLFFLDFLVPELWGLSDDAKHVTFGTATQMLPDNVAPGYPNGANNLYQWDDGVLSLAGILPDGTVPPEGSQGEGSLGYATEGYRRDMSSDGSRLLFGASASAGGPRQLYQRIDGTRTVWISEPEGTDESEPTDVAIQAATPDGRNVIFVTDSPLLDEDTAPGPDLYRWADGPDPEHEQNLTLITHNGQAKQYRFDSYGDPVVGVSDDGGTVYYRTETGQLFVWDHGTTRLIKGIIADATSAIAAQPGNGRVTPSGAYLALLENEQMYLYSREDDTLVCASCSAGSGGVRIKPEISSSPAETFNIAIRPHFLADDGRVFFTSSKDLIPQDVNGVADAYQFDPTTGMLSLLSSGKGKDPSGFLDAGADGNDVFIATRQSLVGTDSDELVDIYDVRSGGGFPLPETAPGPCSGESCQGAASLSPSAAVDSSSAAGRGNVNQHRHRCTRVKRRSGRCGKGKHHHSRHHRPANHNRRAAK